MESNEEYLKELLGRNYQPDERDENFPMRALFPSSTPDKHYKYYWSNGWWGDQGRTSQCVAYSWIHWLEDGSVTQDLKQSPISNPRWLYTEAQRNDYWPGENYEGTSVRAGAKVLQREGFISSYRWTRSVDELATALLTLGPVVVGTNWYYSMFFPDADGNIKVSGSNVGGHAYIINGVNTKKKVFRIKNSWGRSWGKNGYAYISFDDMQRLLNEQGECCLATEIKKI